MGDHPSWTNSGQFEKEDCPKQRCKSGTSTYWNTEVLLREKCRNREGFRKRKKMTRHGDDWVEEAKWRSQSMPFCAPRFMAVCW
jgi:hypothetical protein